MRKIFGLVFVWAAVAMLGCSTTASVTALQPIEGGLNRYRRAIVTIASNPEVQWRDEARIVESRLKFAVMEKLRATKKFQEVTDEAPSQPADSDLKIVLTVANLRAYPGGGYGGPNVGIGVGGGSRGAGGFFGLGLGTFLPSPGSSDGMTVQVEMLDARTGKRVGFLDATASRGDLGEQAEAIAEKIAAEIATK